MKQITKIVLITIGAGLMLAPGLRAEDQTPPPPAAPNAVNPPPRGGPGGNWGERAQKREQHLIRALNLTADQQAKWAALDQQEITAMSAVKGDPSLSREQRWGKLKEIRESIRVRKEALLTPPQLEKLKKILERHSRHDGGEGGPGGAGGGPPPPPAGSN